jgi:hypothetical protein
MFAVYGSADTGLLAFESVASVILPENLHD